MKRNTIFYEALELAGMKAQYDGHVKKLLSFRQVISQILVRTLTEYEGRTPLEAARWIEPETFPRSGKRTKRPEREASLLVGKSEVSDSPGEGIFYAAKMLTEQYGRCFSKSNYQKLRKVYSIWVCMNVPNYIGNALVEYKISRNDGIGSGPEKQKNYDKLSVILICLNTKKGLGEPGSLHHFLNVLLSPSMDAAEKIKILSRVYGIKMEKGFRKELEDMWNLGEAIEEKALRKGRKEGRKEGSRMGDAKRLVRSVEKAMEAFHVDLKAACEGIGSSVEEYTKAAAMVKPAKNKM